MKNPIQRYLVAGNICLKQGHFATAYDHYLHLIKSGLLPKYRKNWPEQVYPEKNFIVNEQNTFIYVPVPKAACSSIKMMIFLLSCHEKDSDYRNEVLNKPRLLHYSALQPFLLSNYSHSMAQQLINDPSYFKFTIVRNPFSRLVSAYLSKLVRNQDLAITNPIVKTVYQQQNLEPDYLKGISFRQFIHYVCNSEDQALNEHWRPQYRILGDINLDFIGRFERLKQELNFLQNKLNLPSELPQINRTSYRPCQTQENYADYDAITLRKLANFPHSKSFYDQDLIDLVQKRYSVDLEIFNYSFENQ